MIGIVQPDGDELAHIADAGAKAQPGLRHALDQRQVSRVQRGKTRKPRRRQHIARNIGHMRRQIAHPALIVQQPRLFRARRPITQQFHPVPLFMNTDAA